MPPRSRPPPRGWRVWRRGPAAPRSATWPRQAGPSCTRPAPAKRAAAPIAASTIRTHARSSRSDWSSNERAQRANQCDSTPRSEGSARRARPVNDVHPPMPAVREAVARALAEDLLPLGDITGALIPVDILVRAELVAREEGVLAGRLCATETFV